MADARALGECRSGELSDLRAPSRLSSLAVRSLSLLYADTDGDGGLNYWIDSADHIACGHSAGMRQLEQQLALTDYTTVWVGWPKVAPAAGGG